MTCGILAPRPGIESMPPAVEVRSLNHWTVREVPTTILSGKPGPLAIMKGMGKNEATTMF